MTHLASSPPASTTLKPRPGGSVYVVLLLVMLSLIGGMMWWIINRERRSTLAYWETRQNAAADVANARVSDWLADWLADAQMLAAAPSIRAALTGQLGGQTEFRIWLRQQVAAYLSRTAAVYKDRHVYVLNSAGQIIVQSPDAPTLDPAVVAIAQTVVREPRLRIDVLGDVPESSTLSFTVAVFAATDAATAESEPSHDVIGTVTLVTAAAETLFPLLSGETVPSRTGETLLVRHEGNEIVYLNPLRHRPANSRQLRIPFDTSPLPARLALLGELPFGAFIDYRGVPVFAAMRRIALTEWGLVHKIDRAEAFAGFRATARLEAAVGGLLILTLTALLGSQRRHQRAQARMAADEARLRLASIVESSDDAIIGTTLDGIITSWNAGAQRIYGYAPKEMIGRPVSILIPPDRREDLPVILDRLKRGEGVAHLETERVRKDGRRIDVALTTSAITDAQGTVIGVSTIARDVTERRRAEEEIHRLNAELEERVNQRTAELSAAVKELESISYTVSHDLRAPVRHVDGFCQLLLEHTAGYLDETAVRYVRTVIEANAKMGRMIDDLLGFLATGRGELHLRRVELGDLVEESLRALEPALRTRCIEWHIGTLPAVTADPELLRMVCTNLLSNAIKFTAHQPAARIDVAATRGAHDEVIVSVRDNGVGFDMQYVDKLFGVFQRLHSVEQFEGSGIGLATVRRIIHRHGGRVWAEGEVGRGATFYFSLRAAERR